MKRTTFICLISACCLMCVFANAAAAQTVTGSLVGHIEDVNGGAIPGARIVVTDVDRGTKRDAVTNEEGNFSIDSVDPGVYRVEIEQANFKKSIRERVEVAINTTVRTDATLEAGEISEVVQISGDQVQLKTDRADVSGQVTNQQTANLPLSVDRNYQSALETIPGVSEPVTVGSSFGNPNGSLISRINGQNERYNNFQLDGTINNQTNVISQTAIVPPADAIQVVDVSTNSYDAEQGRAAGGVVNVQIKSGTNDLRGSVFIYNTNSYFKAKNTLSTIEQPNTNLTQYGFTIGGPIIKDKTFFFGDYQGGRDRRGQNTLLSVPIAAYRNGDFSTVLGSYLCVSGTTTIRSSQPGCPTGATRVLDMSSNGQMIQRRDNQIYRPSLTSSTTRIAYADNIIPQAEFNPAARAIFNLLPLPNLPGITNNYEATGSFIQDRDSFDVKVNHNFTANTTAFARYSYFKSLTSDVPVFGDLGGPNSNGGATASIGPGRNDSVSANVTHVFSPKLITEFRFGYVRVHITGTNPSAEGLGNSLGIPGTNIDEFFSATGIPQIAISGYDSLGSATTLPFDITENSYNIVNNWTRIFGNHTIRFGGDIRRLKLDKSQATSSNPRGLFTFTTNVTGVTASTGRPAPLTTNANAVASFLLGQAQSVRRTTVAQLGGYLTPQYFFFAQDRWQVNPKLTVSYGLRYEIYPYPSGTNSGDQSRYDPATNTVLVSGFGPVNERVNVKTEYGNFAPRLGIAYRFDDKTVIRTGYGISYVPIVLNTLANQNFGSQIDVQIAGTSASFAPRDASGNLITLSTGIPSPAIIDLTSGVVVPPNNAVVGVVNPDAKRGYIQSYNFTVERDLWGFVTSAGYVGSRGTRLPGTLNINAAGPGAVTADRPFARLYGRTADVLLSDFMLSNTYHSLQIQSDRRFTKPGGRLTVAYTLSRSTDYTDAFALLNDINIDANRGPSPFDRKHNLAVSHVIDLPFGDGGSLFDEDGLRWQGLFGGFTLSGTFIARSGTPIDITGTNAASTATQGSANRPDQTGPAQILGGLGPGQLYFDTSVFTNPAAFTFGNARRNSLRGPRYINYNATLARTFSLTERFRLQGQMTVFNVTNSPHFSDPVGSFISGNFGQSINTFGERQIRFGLRFLF
ncbi:MAG: carboxypeptidase regulatory-like domain-containing protein [Acidobacteriota bacterium]|nr:carboxypeptidase regulatory-like domain-containing protein [Acidobacteriota bacterium]